MMRLIKSLRTRRGATAVEYLVMLILTALFVLAIIKVFGGTVKSKYTAANDELGGTLAAEENGSGSGGENLGPTASYSGPKSQQGSEVQGAASGGGEGGSEGGSDKSDAKAKNAEKFAEGGDKGGGDGSGGGGDDDDSVGDGDDSSQRNDGGKATRPGAGTEGKDSSVNPIVILAALLLLGVLFYVMSAGKQD